MKRRVADCPVTLRILVLPRSVASNVAHTKRYACVRQGLRRQGALSYAERRTNTYGWRRNVGVVPEPGGTVEALPPQA